MLTAACTFAFVCCTHVRAGLAAQNKNKQKEGSRCLRLRFAYAYRVVWPLLYLFNSICICDTKERTQHRPPPVYKSHQLRCYTAASAADGEGQRYITLAINEKRTTGVKHDQHESRTNTRIHQLPLLLRHRLQGLRAKGGAGIAYRRTTDCSTGCGRSSKRHERGGDDRANGGRGRGGAAHALGSTTRHARPVAVPASCEHGARL